MAKSGAAKVQAVAIGHNSGGFKAIIERLKKAQKVADEAKGMFLNVYNEAEDQGFDRKALKEVWKCINKPKSAKHLAEVNRYREMYGDLPLFNAALCREEDEEEAA